MVLNVLYLHNEEEKAEFLKGLAERKQQSATMGFDAGTETFTAQYVSTRTPVQPSAILSINRQPLQPDRMTVRLMGGVIWMCVYDEYVMQMFEAYVMGAWANVGGNYWNSWKASSIQSVSNYLNNPLNFPQLNDSAEIDV